MKRDYRHFRQSHVVLVFDLIIAEVILISLYLILRIPKSFLLTSVLNLNQELTNILNTAGILYFIFLSVIELIIILVIALKWAGHEYEINQGMIIHRQGIVKITEETYSLRSLGTTTISQGILGRILNFGTIKLYSPLLKQEYFLRNVHDPRHILEALEDDINSGVEKGTIYKKH